MEKTKNEYIDKLKEDLNVIEQRYQHLLNENCMIGEDFRSQAAENKYYAHTLEQRIEGLQNDIKGLNQTVDDKDLELVRLERQNETFQMQNEETLTYYDQMRKDRNGLHKLAEEQSSLALTRQSTIEKIT